MSDKMDEGTRAAFEAACEIYAESDDEKSFFLTGVKYGRGELKAKRAKLRELADFIVNNVDQNDITRAKSAGQYGV